MEKEKISILLDELKRMFEAYFHGIKQEKYFGKERELISRFAFDKLVKNVGCCELYFDSAQISIETRVTQIQSPGIKQKPEVCKDLIIWYKPNQNCFSEENIPLCIMEWKHNKHFPGKHDIEWLQSYTSENLAYFGLAININTGKYSLQITLISEGNAVEENWLRFV